MYQRSVYDVRVLGALSSACLSNLFYCYFLQRNFAQTIKQFGEESKVNEQIRSRNKSLAIFKFRKMVDNKI